MRVLLVEDDETMAQLLSRSLEEQHYVVDAVADSEAGWMYGSTFNYDLILLAVVLPKLDGIQLCQRLRAEGCQTPILLLMAQTTSAAKIQGLDAGADDYVVKPFDIAELIARIRALLRRGSANASPILAWENLRLNPSTCQVTYNHQPLTLTAKEYELLELLLRDCQHVFSIDEILDSLWSSEEFPAEATVRSHIRHLRYKLSAAGAPNLIATVHGRGYYLKAAPPTQETTSTDQPALLLLVDNDPRFTQPLVNLATKWKIRTAIAPTVASARIWFSNTATTTTATTVNVVLLRLPALIDGAHQQEWFKELMRSATPILIVGERKHLLAVLKKNDVIDYLPPQRFVESRTSPEQLLIAVEELLS